MRADRQTDRQTYTLIAILRTPVESKVKRRSAKLKGVGPYIHITDGVWKRLLSNMDDLKISWTGNADVDVVSGWVETLLLILRLFILRNVFCNFLSVLAHFSVHKLWLCCAVVVVGIAIGTFICGVVLSTVAMLVIYNLRYEQSEYEIRREYIYIYIYGQHAYDSCTLLIVITTMRYV